VLNEQIARLIWNRWITI